MNETIQGKSRVRGYMLIFLAGCLWGTMGIFVDLLTARGISALVIVFLRYTGGLIVLTVLILCARGPSAFRISRRGLLCSVLAGLLGQALFSSCYTESIRLIGMSNAVVLLYTAPVFVCIMSRIFYREPITKNKIASLAINIFGCWLCVTGGTVGGLKLSGTGILAGVGAGFLYATMTIISKTAAEQDDPLTICFFSFVTAWVFAFIAFRPLSETDAFLHPDVLLIVLLYGIFPTAGAYGIYLMGLGHGLEASRVPVIASVETVVAALIGILWNGEAATLFKFVGIALVLISIAVMNLLKTGRAAGAERQK